MKQHRQSTAAMALMTVAALIVTAWASSAVAGSPAKTMKELAQNAYIYEVFRSQANRPEQRAALITVLQTREASQLMHGLVFLQTREPGHTGKGIACGHSDQRLSRANKEGRFNEPSDASLECHQHIGNLKETLTVGAIDSEFCDDLRKELEYKVTKGGEPADELFTEDGKNPVATPEECREMFPEGQCLCFKIDHQRYNSDGNSLAPPNSGSGTGGHP